MESIKKSHKPNFLYKFLFGGSPLGSKRVDSFDRVAVVVDNDIPLSPKNKANLDYDNFADIDHMLIDEKSTANQVQSAADADGDNRLRNYLILVMLGLVSGSGAFFIHKYCKNIKGFCLFPIPISISALRK